MFDELGNLLFQMQETNGNLGSSSTHDFCISTNVVNDAGVYAIVSPTGIVCSSDILPQVEIKNYGSATLTSVDIRSEEHTSELQSRPHLVCRLLLEKKKKI